MPFIKKNRSQDAQPSSLFIGRTDEISFFVHSILQPDTPTHNILSISGQGGVGKSTLLNRFIAETHEAPFGDYCLIASVNERQATPISIMEKLAMQLHLTGKFDKALKQYREALYRRQIERETLRDRVSESLPDVAGAIVEGIPVAGPLLREGARVATSHLLKEHQAFQVQQDTELLESYIDDLTRAFVTELNRLADKNVTLRSIGQTHQRLILLFFDTFEQLAAETTPWFLDHFLAAQVSSNVVLVVAGRDPIEHISPQDTKRWLPYCDDGTIYWIFLNSFTEDETRMYFVKRGITDEEQIAAIWQLSQGLPLYLGLLTSNPQGDIDPTKDVVVNFLRWIPEQDAVKRRLAQDASLFSRSFTQDDLQALAYVSEQERSVLYHWLTEQPFVQARSQDGRYLYHNVAQELFCRHLYQRSQDEYYAMRRALAHHYQKQLERIQEEGDQEVYHSIEWLELVLSTAFQLFFLPDKASHLKAIEQVLIAYTRSNKEREKEIVRLLQQISQEHFMKRAVPSVRRIARQLLQYIEAYSMRQDRIATASTLIKLVAHEPSFPSKLLANLYYRRGGAYWALEDYQQALDDFNHALELDPQNAWTYEHRGYTYIKLQDYQQALADYNHALELDPNFAWAYSQRGTIYRDLKDYQQALSEFDRAIELAPKEDPRIYYERGLTYTALKDYQQALNDFNHAFELAPKEDAWTYAQRGYFYWKLEDYQQALNDFNCAIELAPEKAWFHENRGYTYIRLKDYQQALANYNHALELDPNLAWAYSQRGTIHRTLKDYQQALRDFNRALELAPQNARIYGQRGLTYIKLKDYQQALSDFNRTIELAPQTDWYYYQRGLIYRDLKDYRQALNNFNRAIELAPQIDWYYYERGLTYTALKDYQRTLTDFNHALGLEPMNIGINWIAQWVRMCQEKPHTKMSERLNTIAQMDPQHYVAYVCRGVADWLDGEAKDALTELEQAILLEQEEWDAHFWKGLVCASLGQDERAFTAIEKALEMNLPHELLAPLRWFEQERPDFYEKYAVSLLTKYE